MIIENIPAKDLDPHIDLFLPALLKKGADTNAFIGGSAE
jgi:hypothetical protein